MQKNDVSWQLNTVFTKLRVFDFSVTWRRVNEEPRNYSAAHRFASLTSMITLLPEMKLKLRGVKPMEEAEMKELVNPDGSRPFWVSELIRH